MRKRTISLIAAGLLLPLSGCVVDSTSGGIVVASTRETAAPYRVADLGWLAGRWEGQGHMDGVTGRAIRDWTPPTEGAMSSTFQWHMPDSSHVHYAFMVLWDTPQGIDMRFIHYGPDFETFEDAPLEYTVTEISDSRVVFSSKGNCRADFVIDELDDLSCRARWIVPGEGSEPLTIEYLRVGGVVPFARSVAR
ncbi:MAG: DUF6265 family protein [Planctomycetota bacterium]|jgi:hypothetical protein